MGTPVEWGRNQSAEERLILDVDIGNSRLKWRFIGENAVAERGAVPHSTDTWSAIAAGHPTVGRVRVSNVAGPAMAQAFADWVQARFGVGAEFAVARQQAADVTCGYRSPETLGVDRWLAVLAAWEKVVGPCVVVDAGSAITVDILADRGCHLGGYIVPGLRMMQRALYTGTSAVKIEDPAVARLSPGVDTREAVLHGCLAMAIALIQKTCADVRASVVVLTGGDAEVLANLLDGNVAVEVDPELVLDGLALALP